MDCEKFLSMLDDYIDSCISDADKAAMLEHARVCEKCSAELKSADELRRVLGSIDADVSVPLAAQAAWRAAVKKESSAMRVRRIYRVAAAVAAALVLIFGVNAGMKLMQKDTAITGEPQASDFSFVATDGDDADVSLVSKSAMAASVKISSVDIDHSAEVVCQLVSEFNGSIGIRNISGGTAYITASIPADEMPGFMTNIDYVGNIMSQRQGDVSNGRVSVEITIVKPSK